MCHTPTLLSWSELTEHSNGRKKERKKEIGIVVSDKKIFKVFLLVAMATRILQGFQILAQTGSVV